METPIRENPGLRGKARMILAPLSAVYRAALYLDKSLTRAARADVPVVSVGNLTWGGAGKTPVVVRIARDFIAAGKKTAVITRGYARRNPSRAPLWVSGGGHSRPTVFEAGDEPCLLARKLPAAAVIACKNRRAAVAAAIESFGAQVAILDDGFQHWALERDLDVVCVRAREPFGNGFLIPAGSLREPQSSLARADMIVITHADEIPAESLSVLRRKISASTAAPVVETRHAPDGIKKVFGGGEAASVAGEIVGFAGIGDPDGFEVSLRRIFPSLKRFISFGDHKWYGEKELLRLAEENPGVSFVTTLKDAVRFDGFRRLPEDRFFYLDMKLEIISGENFWLEKLKPLF